METQTWQNLMDRVLADYQPGRVQMTAPGAGTTGDDPLAIQYANMRPLALIMNEGVDATVNAGADRNDLLDNVADNAGEDFSRADVDAILSDSEPCPDIGLLAAFCEALAIDTEIAVDAAQRGGCTNYGAALPPGY